LTRPSDAQALHRASFRHPEDDAAEAAEAEAAAAAVAEAAAERARAEADEADDMLEGQVVTKRIGDQ